MTARDLVVCSVNCSCRVTGPQPKAAARRRANSASSAHCTTWPGRARGGKKEHGPCRGSWQKALGPTLVCTPRAVIVLLVSFCLASSLMSCPYILEDQRCTVQALHSSEPSLTNADDFPLPAFCTLPAVNISSSTRRARISPPGNLRYRDKQLTRRTPCCFTCKHFSCLGSSMVRHETNLPRPLFLLLFPSCCKLNLIHICPTEPLR